VELVANAQNIKLVLVVQNQAKQDQLIVVVSALSKVTDLLHLASLSRFN
jgi:aspartokinase/homoserine dehydrogenase 1